MSFPSWTLCMNDHNDDLRNAPSFLILSQPGKVQEEEGDYLNMSTCRLHAVQFGKGISQWA